MDTISPKWQTGSFSKFLCNSVVVTVWQCNLLLYALTPNQEYCVTAVFAPAIIIVHSQRYLDEAEREKMQYAQELKEYQQTEAYQITSAKIQDKRIKKGDNSLNVANVYHGGYGSRMSIVIIYCSQNRSCSTRANGKMYLLTLCLVGHFMHIHFLFQKTPHLSLSALVQGHLWQRYMTLVFCHCLTSKFISP